MSGARDYSTTPGSNLDLGGIFIGEGWARSSVGNAVQELLSQFQKFLLDIGGGTLTTHSVTNAYLLSLPTEPLAYGDNLYFAARSDHTNSGASTINVNSRGLKNIKKQVAGVATDLAAGEYPSGHVGFFTHASADTAVILLNPFITTLTGKTIDASLNTLSNLTTGMFAANVVDTDATFAANSDTRLSPQRAIKAYVDTTAAGINWAAGGAVANASTANLTLSGEQTIDGVLTSASRILVKNQTTATQNGVYVTAAGAWARATDADAGAEFIRLGVFVNGGSTQLGTTWVCTRTTAPTLGVDNIAFVQNGASAVYTAGTGLSLAGNVFSITDAELLALAGLTSVSNSFPYFTGVGTADLALISSAGRSLVAGTDAAAQRTTLGLGTAALTNTGTSGSTLGVLNTNLVFTGSNVARNTGAGTAVVPLYINNDGTPNAGTETILDISPGFGLEALRSVQIAAINNGSNVVKAVIRTSNGVAPADTVTINADKTVRLHGYTAGALVSDASGNVTASTSAATLASGTYTPTLFNTTNIDSSTPQLGMWMRIGNVMHVSGFATVDPTAGAVTLLGVSLPIASNFASALDAIGSCWGAVVNTASPYLVSADTANDRVSVSFVAPGGASASLYWSFQYLII